MAKQLAPSQCRYCQSKELEMVGFGLWDGKSESGLFYKRRCQSCATVWYYADATDGKPMQLPETVEAARIKKEWLGLIAWNRLDVLTVSNGKIVRLNSDGTWSLPIKAEETATV